MKTYTSNTYTFLYFTKHFSPSVLQRRKSSVAKVIYSKSSLNSHKYFQNMSNPPVKKDPLNVTIRNNESFSNLLHLNT